MTLIALLVVAVLCLIFTPAKIIAAIAIFLAINLYPIASSITLIVISIAYYFIKHRRKP